MTKFVKINGIYYNVDRIQSFWSPEGSNSIRIKFIGSSNIYDSFPDPDSKVYDLLVKNFSLESRKVLNG